MIHKKCSFCQRSSQEVAILIEAAEKGDSPDAYICDKCVLVCVHHVFGKYAEVIGLGGKGMKETEK